MTGPTLTRRELLIAGVGLTGSALLAGLFGFRVPAGLGDPAYLREASYGPLVGGDFRVVTSRGGVNLKLVGVRNLGPIRHGGQLLTGREHFALDFEGRAGTPLASSLQTIVHPQLGRYQMFLSPVDRSSSVLRYEAVVNRFEIKIGSKNHV